MPRSTGSGDPSNHPAEFTYGPGNGLVQGQGAISHERSITSPFAGTVILLYACCYAGLGALLLAAGLTEVLFPYLMVGTVAMIVSLVVQRRR